jgi:hypothetical protein
MNTYQYSCLSPAHFATILIEIMSLINSQCTCLHSFLLAFSKLCEWFNVLIGAICSIIIDAFLPCCALWKKETPPGGYWSKVDHSGALLHQIMQVCGAGAPQLCENPETQDPSHYKMTQSAWFTKLNGYRAIRQVNPSALPTGTGASWSVRLPMHL